MAKQPKAAPAATTEQGQGTVPQRVKMIYPFGFIDEETGANHYWHQDQVVFDPEHIAILIERGVEFTVLEE